MMHEYFGVFFTDSDDDVPLFVVVFTGVAMSDRQTLLDRTFTMLFETFSEEVDILDRSDSFKVRVV